MSFKYFTTGFFMLLVTCLVETSPKSDITSMTKNFHNKYQDISRKNKRMLQQEEAEKEWKPLRVKFVYRKNYDPSHRQTVDRYLMIAKTFMAQALLVKRVKSPLQFSRTGFYACAEEINEDLQEEIHNDADLLVFVTLLADVEHSLILAQAGPCATMHPDFRPQFAAINFGPKIWQNPDPSPVLFEKGIATTIHEMIHALGFVEELYDYYVDTTTGEPYTQAYYYQNNVLHLATPRIILQAREYFNCEHLKGLPLEDINKEGTRNSHFEERLFLNELMTGYSDPGDYVLSIFTFRVLEDSGWYRTGSVQPDTMIFGFKKGCDFVYEGCRAKNPFEEFCLYPKPVLPYESYPKIQSCNFYQSGIGGCSPYEESNYCMVNVLGLDCRDQNTPEIFKQVTGQDLPGTLYFGYDSRCFTANSDKDNGEVLACLKFQCNEDNTAVTVYVGGKAYQCEEDGQKVSFPGNQLNCPENIQLFCSSYEECPQQCNQRGFCLKRQCICKKGYSGYGCENKCDSIRYKDQCLDKCPQGTLLNEDSNYCVGCPLGCTKCSSLGRCTQCLKNYKLFEGVCILDYSEITPFQQRASSTRSVSSGYLLVSVVILLTVFI